MREVRDLDDDVDGVIRDVSDPSHEAGDLMREARGLIVDVRDLMHGPIELIDEVVDRIDPVRGPVDRKTRRRAVAPVRAAATLCGSRRPAARSPHD